MSGKPGRSGRLKGSGSAHVAELSGMVLAYYVAGHSIRETARVFRMNPSWVGHVVKGHSRSKSEAAKLLNARRSAVREAAAE